jgi:predicted transcriptional regulator with HTH domain
MGFHKKHLLLIVLSAFSFILTQCAVANEYSPEQLAGLADLGRLFFQALTSDSSEIASHRKKAQFKDKTEEELVRALVLYLYYIARKEGHVFESGTFVVHDPSGNVYNFLMNLKNKYARDSSHFNSLAKTEGKHWLSQLGKNHYGYDIFIPALNKRTILFNKIEEDGTVFYLKPESRGTAKTADLVAHSISYIKTVGRRRAPSIFGSENSPHASRESVPQDILSFYLELVESAEYLPEISVSDSESDSESSDSESQKTDLQRQKRVLARRARSRGIQAMYEDSKKLADQGLVAFKSFFDELGAKRSEEVKLSRHVDKRFGHEVVITPQEVGKYHRRSIKPSDWNFPK